MELSELKKIMQDSGIAGAGGAGFPTYMKLNKKVDTIILNCAECEPLLKVHRQLLASYSMEIIKTLEEIALTLQAKEIIVAIKKPYKKAIEEVEAVLNTCTLKVRVRLGILSEVYPAGDEVITIYETTGKVVKPGGIPLDIGIAVFNVETILNTYFAIKNSKPVYEKYLTIAGEVKRPVTRCIPIGMKISDVIELAGGVKIENPIFISGGPMTGKIVTGNDVITKTTNAVLVLSENHPIINKKRSNIFIDMKRAMATCSQCQMCTDLCPRNLLGHPIEPHLFMRATTSGITKDLSPFLNTFFCSGCGLCEMYVCHQGLSPRKLMTFYKYELRKKGILASKDIKLDEVKLMRNYRKIPMKRLIERLGLEVYDTPAILSEVKVKAEIVRIPMSQHIGVPAIPVVKNGDYVITGQVIATAKEDSLSIPCHSSINGEVIEVNDRYVIIKTKIDNN